MQGALRPNIISIGIRMSVQLFALAKTRGGGEGRCQQQSGKLRCSYSASTSSVFFWEGAAVSEAYSLAPRQDKGKQNLLQAATFL